MRLAANRRTAIRPDSIGLAGSLRLSSTSAAHTGRPDRAPRAVLQPIGAPGGVPECPSHPLGTAPPPTLLPRSHSTHSSKRTIRD